MKIHYALAVLLTLAGSAAANPWDTDPYAEVRVEATAKYSDDNLADFFRPKDPFLGYIGKTFQRLHITYTAIRQDAKNHRLYHIRGTSQVKANRCDFEGEIIITRITTYPDVVAGDEFSEANRLQYHIVEDGRIEATYELREDPKQALTGVFKGTLMTYFYVNADHRMVYDDLYTDPESSWSNNQHSGTWMPYGNKAASKVANWGDHGIPDDEGLNADHHDFMPDEKYKANGWEDFFKKDGGGD